MDKLPEVLLQEILSRLDDSADVARCRIAWKSFNNVYSHLRSINLKCSLRMYFKSRRRVLTSMSTFCNPLSCLNPSSKVTRPYKSIFLDLISNMEVVESVCISLEGETKDMWEENYLVAGRTDDNLHFTDDAFVMKCVLPRVSKHLKSLSLSSFFALDHSNVLRLVSHYFLKLIDISGVEAVFPKMSYLCMQPSVWSELEACGKWDIPYAMIKGLKTFSAYLSLVDPSLSFSCVACVLDKCVHLSEIEGMEDSWASI
ncbi:F-box/LRR-repeat protein-like protein [Tanacetum coccineum]